MNDENKKMLAPDSLPAAEIGFDYETYGLAGLPKSISSLDIVDSDAIISSKADIFSWRDEINVDAIKEYRHLLSEENYWKNKFNDLSEAFKVLSAYDVDVDYTELILRTREASRNRKIVAEKTAKLEEDYPGIETYRNAVFPDDINEHDPILNRNWSDIERRKRNFDTEYSFGRFSKINSAVAAVKQSQAKMSAAKFTMQGTTPAVPKNYLISLNEDCLMNAHKIARD